MNLVAFSKMFKRMSPRELVALAKETQLDGWDLAVRPGYPVTPENAPDELAVVARLFAENGLCIPMVSAPMDLLDPESPAGESIMRGMGRAQIRLLKLGYYPFDPALQNYWAEVDRIRGLLDRWQKLGQSHDVKICLHTHSGKEMFSSAGALALVLRDFDPRWIGAYLDPAHLREEGERFANAVAIAGKHLSAVALKDALLERQSVGGLLPHGSCRYRGCEAGAGMVDWSTVFADLKAACYEGPLTIHCEFMGMDHPDFLSRARQEIRFFNTFVRGLWPERK
jgi:sugar phosphate isomerase/epimerase